MATLPTLPTEIIVEILIRLPPKPLYRFKTVAKHFKTLISSPNFIKLHLTQTLISKNPQILICHDSLSTAEIPSNNHFNFRFSAVDHPVKHLPDHPTVQLLGSVNGILCISDRFKNTLFLYNPGTNSHRLLPNVPTNIPDGDDPLLTKYNPFVSKRIDHIVVFGFGYDSVNDDYKLLRVIECYVDRLQSCREVRLYSLRNNSWKPVEDKLDCYPNQHYDGVNVNGVLYFAVSDENGKRLIKCFDIVNERFNVFDLFEYDLSFDNSTFVLMELGGCFTVMTNYLIQDYNMEFDWRLAKADFWVMKEYGKTESWVKLFSISDPDRFGCLTHIRPVMYSRDGGRVLIELNGSELCWYDWSRKKKEKVKLTGVSSMDIPFDTYAVVSSLVSLETEKEKAKAKEKEAKGKSSVPKKNINNKNSDGFLSTGFKLRL